MSVLQSFHPYKISPAYVADAADRRAAKAEEAIARIDQVARLSEGLVAACEMLASDMEDDGFDVEAREVAKAAESLDEICKTAAVDYLGPAKNLLRDRIAG